MKIIITLQPKIYITWATGSPGYSSFLLVCSFGGCSFPAILPNSIVGHLLFPEGCGGGAAGPYVRGLSTLRTFLSYRSQIPQLRCAFSH